MFCVLMLGRTGPRSKPLRFGAVRPLCAEIVIVNRNSNSPTANYPDRSRQKAHNGPECRAMHRPRPAGLEANTCQRLSADEVPLPFDLRFFGPFPEAARCLHPVSIFAPLSWISARETMWYRSKHDRVLCPLISIARFSDIPIFSTMFRTADRPQVMKQQVRKPASFTASRHES